MAGSNFWPNKSFISFDTETTGLDFENDRIIQIAIAVFVHGQHVWSFNWYLNTKRPSAPEALAVHGITDEMRWAEGVDSKEVMRHIQALFRRMRSANSPLVAFNAPFDFTMLRNEWKRFDLDFDLSDLWVIDPLVIDRHYQKNIPVFTAPHMRQAQMAARYGLSAPTHNALDDAICAGHIALAQGLHYPGIRHSSPRELHKHQTIWFDDFTKKVQRFAEKKAISFSLPQWPFGDDVIVHAK